MPFDHSVYPTLIALSQTLARRDGAPAETKVAALGWLGRDAEWKEARAEVRKFVKLVGQVDGERKEHEAECGKAGRLLSAPSHLRLRVEQVCRTAEHLESRMDAGERNAHIRAAGKDPDSLDSTVREIHNWLAVDDVARKMENRDSHIQVLRENQDALRGSSWKVASTVLWHRNEPLVPGDRLRWTDTSGAKPQDSEAIVLSISAGKHPNKVDSIEVEKLGKNTRASRSSGKKKTLWSWDLNSLTENCECRRMEWLDESVRNLEWIRQMPERDAVYSIDCTDSLAPGDRIRFNPVPASGVMGTRR